MALSKEDIIHLGELSRIRLTEEEISAFQGELSSILEFVATLRSKPTTDVIPMAGGTKVVTTFRDDEENVPSLGSPEELRSSFLKTDAKGNLVVPKIFDRD